MQRKSLAAIDHLERAVPAAGGVVLRYGNFYGPGASDSLVELVRKRRFPVIGADDEPAAAAEWLPYLAEAVGAKPPMRVPKWLARLIAGTVAVQWMTEGRGASNAKAKRELGWQLTWPSWRQGFREGLA